MNQFAFRRIENIVLKQDFIEVELKEGIKIILKFY